MQEQLTIGKSLDLRGVLCPVNAVRAKTVIASLDEGELLALVVDEGESLIRVVQSLNDAGHRIFRSERLEHAVRIIVGKGGRPGRNPEAAA